MCLGQCEACIIDRLLATPHSRVPLSILVSFDSSSRVCGGRGRGEGGKLFNGQRAGAVHQLPITPSLDSRVHTAMRSSGGGTLGVLCTFQYHTLQLLDKDGPQGASPPMGTKSAWCCSTLFRSCAATGQNSVRQFDLMKSMVSGSQSTPSGASIAVSSSG